MMRNAFFLARHYLRSAPWRTAILVLGTAVALFLPIFTVLVGRHVEKTLLQRAEDTPIVIGAKGNEFDLTMASLYFRGQVGDDIPYRERSEVERLDYGLVVPLHVRFTVDGAPLVGTGLEYFEARHLSVSEGRLPAQLGEVVAGSTVAEEARLHPGDTVRSDLTNLYNLAGSYPVVLEVVGVLAPSDGPDDEAFFTDLRTVWVVDGRLHGHDDVTREQALNPEAREGENLEATAAIFLFDRITANNRASFHQHGGDDEAPISSLLVFPPDARARDLLLGDFALKTDRQAVQPLDVVRSVLGIVLRARQALGVYFVAVALSTFAFFVLVLALSLRLRRTELELMQRIGCSRSAIGAIVGVEVACVILMAALAAALLAGAGLWLVDARLIPG